MNFYDAIQYSGNYGEMRDFEVIGFEENQIQVSQVDVSFPYRICERCGEIELVPGSLIELNHGPGCHEGWTELLCKSCHGKVTFQQGYWPKEVRKKDRSFDDKCSAIWLGKFEQLVSRYPNDPLVTPWITEQQKNLEIIYQFNDRADAQDWILQRKKLRFPCENPECKLCHEKDLRILTDHIPKELTHFERRIMKVQEGKTILCFNCFAKLRFVRVYWLEKFRTKEKTHYPIMIEESGIRVLKTIEICNRWKCVYSSWDDEYFQNHGCTRKFQRPGILIEEDSYYSYCTKKRPRKIMYIENEAA